MLLRVPDLDRRQRDLEHELELLEQLRCKLELRRHELGSRKQEEGLPQRQQSTVDPRHPEDGDRLTLSGFAAKSVRPWSKALVQAYVHLPNQADTVRASARDRDPATRTAGSEPLLAALHGDQIRIQLDAGRLKIDEPVQEFVWMGAPVCASFSVRVPLINRTHNHHLKVSAEINGVPAGRLKFVMQVDRKAPRLSSAEALPGYEPYRYVFMSYASDDRAFVLDRARTLEALGVPHFLDVESLRAGDLWERKLKEHVGRSDLFMLFWSPAAKASKWVAQEARWALELQLRSATAEPDIKPYQVDPYHPVSPPPELSHLHFERTSI